MHERAALVRGAHKPAERNGLSDRMDRPPDMSEALERLTARVRACRICVEHPLGRALPHEPRPVLRPSSSARILLASQAPGTKVHISGMPFTDASGDRLRSWLGVSAR